jgi:DHA1 family bicyclomycin/chloramphenicol resistance-like MFS transporter
MAPKALQPGTFALTALLGFLTSFGPLSVDLYLPSLPEVGRALGASEPRVQLTISLYLIGYAIGQMGYGPISDRFGRKPVILAAVLIYAAGTVICLASQAIEHLILGRIAQALGASGALIVTRAVVRDLYEGARAGHQLSIMGVIMGVAPIVAPIVGAVLLTLSGWRAGFVFQLGIGCIAALLVWRFLGETHRPSFTALGIIVANYRKVAVHPVFLANMVIGSLAYSGLFAWIAGLPFVLQALRGLTPLQFSICYAISSAGYLVGGILATRLVLRIGLDRTAGLGALALALAGAAALASVAIDTALPITLTASMGLCLAGMGLVLPQVMAGALTPFPHNAGTASSVMGFAQLCSGALMSIIVGNTLGNTAWPVAIGLAMAGGLALAVWAATRGLRTQAVSAQEASAAAE